MKTTRFNLIALLLLLSASGLRAQSVLTRDDYFYNPKSYLSLINNANVTTGLLIDRTIFDSSPLLQTSGTGTVTTISSGGWSKIYRTLRDANLDTTLYPPVDTLKAGADLLLDADKAYAVRMLDFSFNRITSTALSSGDFVENAGHLYDQHSTTSSYTNDRSFAASTFSQYVYGDNVTFYFSSFFFLTNRTTDTIVDMDVDLDDGTGYIDFDFGDYRTGHYNANSEELEIVVKVVFENNITHAQSTRYAHFSVFRKGSNDVPLTGALPPSSSSGRTSVGPDATGYFPDPGIANLGVCYYRNAPHVRICETRMVPPPESVYIWWHILYSPQNTAKTFLKRPLIVVDGFDPYDSRSYYANYTEFDDEMPYKNDGRGLYELLDGDPSPWYMGSPSANMIADLRYRGYDLIFVNFEKGGGDIPTNASYFKDFLQTVVNGSTYRNEFTEEAILIGPSMGGLITRMALKQIENTGAHHYVKAWFSFDAPHKGAYIPLGLQHVIQNLLRMPIFDVGLGKAAHAQLQTAQNTLNTPAAKQLLRYHYQETTSEGHPSPDFTTFYNALDALGYPDKSFNVAITNGGPGKLYSTESSGIITLKTVKLGLTFATADGWGNHNSTSGTFGIANVNDHVPPAHNTSVVTSNQIGYENAPGGFNTALYSFNFAPDNANLPSGDPRGSANITLTRAAFIPTSSALGMPIDQTKIYKSASDYTSPNVTPFDEVKGMTTNEEHVTISTNTKNYFVGKLDNMFTNFTTPMVRASQDLTVTITKPVAYTEMGTMTFGGDGNTYVVDGGAIVNVNAGTQITFKPGVQIKAGTTLSAKIKPIHLYDLNTGRVASDNRPGIDYTKTARSVGVKHIYQTDTSNELIDVVSMRVYPNPATTELNLELPGIGNIMSFKILTTIGKEIQYNDSRNLGASIVDTSTLSPGVYIVEAKDQFYNTYRTKFIKR